MGRTRNSFVEILRILCIFGVFLMHKNGFLLDVASGSQIPWIMLVNVFNFESSLLMMISAYYGNPFASRKKLIKLWIMVLVYSCVGLFIYVAKNGLVLDGQLISLSKNLFPITSGTSWFAAGYIIIWSVAPYVEKMLENISKKEFIAYLLLLLFFFFIVPTFTTFGPVSGNGKDVGTLFVSYCIGRYLRKNNVFDKLSVSFLTTLAAISFFLQFVLNGICVYVWQGILGKRGVILPFSWDHSFLELTLSVALIGLSTKVYFSNKAINFIGKRAFGMLLAEPLTIIPFALFTDYQRIQFGFYYIIIVILYCLMLMTEGLLIESVRRAVFDKFENAFSDLLFNGWHKLLKKCMVGTENGENKKG